MARIWHFHHKCENKFQSKDLLASGEPCPICSEPFIPRSKVSCSGCNTVYYTDRVFDEGHQYICPMKGEPVVFTISGTIRVPTSQPELSQEVTSSQSSSQDSSSQRFRPQSIIRPEHLSKSIDLFVWIRHIVVIIALLLIMYLIATFVFVPVSLWVIATLETIVTEVLAVLPSMILAIGELIRILVLLIASAAILVLGAWSLRLIHKLVNSFATKPSNSFGIVLAAGYKRDPISYLKEKLKLEDDLPDNQVWRKTLNRNREIVLTQQATISLLIIGATTGVLFCYLSAQPLQEARQTVQKIPQLGIGIFGPAILFYGSKFFVGSKGRHFIERLGCAGILGATVVSALVFLPSLLGQAPSSASDITLGIALGIIGDVLVSTLQTVARLRWTIPGEIPDDTIGKLWQKVVE